MSVHNESEKHVGRFSGKYLPDGNPGSEYQQVGGESHKPVPNTKFCGPTKGNKDLPPDRTAGVKSGVGDPLGAGGKGSSKGMSY